MTVESALTKGADLLRFNKMQMVSAQIRDLTGSLQLAWYNMPYMRSHLRTGEILRVPGTGGAKAGDAWSWSSRRFFTPEAYEAPGG